MAETRRSASADFLPTQGAIRDCPLPKRFRVDNLKIDRSFIDSVQRYGCNEIQGNYFSRPLAADAFENFAREHRGH